MSVRAKLGLSVMLIALLFSMQGYALQLVKKAEINGVVWGMAFIDSSQMIFTLREGRVGLMQLNTGEITWLTGLPDIAVDGQGGLFDVAVVHPWVYFTYSKPSPNGAVTTLARAQINHNQIRNWKDLLVTDSATDTSRHFGGRIAFDDSGHVYFGVGDRGQRPNGQDLSRHAGSILRLNLDGSIPTDNPFVGVANAKPEIWSYGHRNPQGLCYDFGSQTLWSSEHGPRGGDEINLIIAGKNYGWPVVSFGKEYWGPLAVGEATSKPGMESPRYVYIPSIAPSGLLCYRGANIPEFQHRLLLGALKLTHLNGVLVDEQGTLAGEQRWFETLGERQRSLQQDAAGHLWMATDNGKIYQVLP